MASPLTTLERKFVEEFGSIYESYGLKRLEGILVGLLLTLDDPASLDDMVELLGRSKGPISVAARRLADIGVIRKVGGPVNRRSYYAAHPDIFYNNFKFNMATVRRNRRVAEQFLDRLDEEDDAHQEPMRENVEHMHDFYSLMESFYQDFSTRWEEKKRERRTASSEDGSAKGEKLSKETA